MLPHTVKPQSRYGPSNALVNQLWLWFYRFGTAVFFNHVIPPIPSSKEI